MRLGFSLSGRLRPTLRAGALASLLSLAAAVLPPSAAQAQVEGSARDDEARALFQAGKVAFEDGRFEAALDYFKQAYALSPRDALLYNIGSAADRLRRDAEALEAFERYLEKLPQAPNRAEVEGRLRVLREALRSAEPAAAPQGPADLAAPPQPAPAHRAQTQPAAEPRAGGDGRQPDTLAPWLVVGGSAAIAVAGGVMLVLAMDDVATVEDAPDGTRWQDIEAAHDRAPTLSALGVGLLGAGVVGATVGAIWLAGGADSQTQVSVTPTAVRLRGTL